MTLLDAHPYDSAKARRRKIKIAVMVVIAVALAALAWMYRNWPEEHSVDKFFNDPGWQKHQQKYSQYTYADFYRDWGPGGEWGLVKSHRIYGSANTKGLGSGGVVVEVIVNERAEHARMFVQKSDKTLTVYPY
jgi:hypothetical protein